MKGGGKRRISFPYILASQERQDEEYSREHQQNYYEGIFSFTFCFLELVFAVRTAEFFVERNWGCTYYAMSVLRNRVRTLVLLEVLRHYDRAIVHVYS